MTRAHSAAIISALLAQTISAAAAAAGCCSYSPYVECGSPSSWCDASEARCTGCGGRFAPDGNVESLMSPYDVSSITQSNPKPAGTDKFAYACVDWSVGSAAMLSAAEAYTARTGSTLPYFGIGSFGSDMAHMGKCYKFAVEGVAKPVVLQVLNSGGDVHEGNFDVQQGAGGFGVHNGCVSPVDADGGATTHPGRHALYATDASAWGARFGGVQTRAGCAALPEYPSALAPASVPQGEPSLRELCARSFQYGFRKEGGDNPRITQAARVPCPDELVAITGLKRTDDADTSEKVPVGGVMTRMFDCAKPSTSWLGNTPHADPAFPASMPCGGDGYTRLDGTTLSPLPPPPPPPSPATTRPAVASTTAPAQCSSCRIARGRRRIVGASAGSGAPSPPTPTPAPATPPTTTPPHTSGAGGPGCCSWDPLLEECGDHCGTDGSTWCHDSASNCQACDGAGFIAGGTPLDNCGGAGGTGTGTGTNTGAGTCAMPAGLATDTGDVDNTGFATRHGKLKLVGNQLSNARGEAVQLMGMSSHGLHWFASCYTKESIKYLAEHWGINLFRAAMYIGEGGYASNKSPATLLKNIVQWCKELGIYVMIDWHVLTPGDPNHWLADSSATGANAIEFFEEMAALYKDEAHVLYEIANEPNGVQWSTVKAYGDKVVAAIRAIDTETIIICGTPTWSQDIHEAARSPLAQPHNVMYAFHFYAGTHMGLVQRVVDTARKIPLFATEWGTSQASGDGGPYLAEASTFLDVFNDADGAMGQTISWAQWSYADKNEKSAALTPGACSVGNWGSTSCSGTFLAHYIKANVPRK